VLVLNPIQPHREIRIVEAGVCASLDAMVIASDDRRSLSIN